MKQPTSAAARVSKAQAELAAAECELIDSALPWQRRLQRNRSTVTLISGFSAGLALALLPSRWWARAGAAVGATAAGAARSGLAPAIVGAVLSHLLSSEDESRKNATSAVNRNAP